MGRAGDGVLPRYRRATIAWLGDDWRSTEQIHTFLKDKYMRGPSMTQVGAMLVKSKEFEQRKQPNCSEWRLSE